MSPVEVRALRPDDAEACDAVVASLPTFFGNAEGIEQCRSAVRSQEGWVATENGDVVGFLTSVTHFGVSAEITWMAVRAERRRLGIGRALVERARGDAARRGRRVLHVLTLGPSVVEEGADTYAGTRAFYEAMGFTPLRELQLRSWEDEHALILACPL